MERMPMPRIARPRKQPNGQWRVQWTNPAGKRESETFSTERDAQDFLDRQRSLSRTGEWFDPDRSNMLLVAWVAECRQNSPKLAPETVKIEARTERAIAASPLADHTLASLDAETIDRWLNSMMRDGVAVSTVARHYRHLNKWLWRAVKLNRLPRNPCEPLEEPKDPEDKEQRYLEWEELIALSEAISPRYRVWVLLMGMFGPRFSEANGLTEEFIDLETGVVKIHWQTYWDQTAGMYVRTRRLKTKKSRREFKVGGFADELAAHIDEWAVPWRDAEGRVHRIVFPNQIGVPLKAASFTGNVFKPALKRAGLDPAFRIHDLRHTAAALQTSLGVGAKQLQALFGHASIKTTFDVYTHLFAKDEDLQADRMTDALNSARGTNVVRLDRKRAS
jgi:integrase